MEGYARYELFPALGSHKTPSAGADHLRVFKTGVFSTIFMALQVPKIEEQLEASFLNSIKYAMSLYDALNPKIQKIAITIRYIRRMADRISSPVLQQTSGGCDWGNRFESSSVLGKQNENSGSPKRSMIVFTTRRSSPGSRGERVSLPCCI